MDFLVTTIKTWEASNMSGSQDIICIFVVNSFRPRLTLDNRIITEAVQEQAGLATIENNIVLNGYPVAPGGQHNIT